MLLPCLPIGRNYDSTILHDNTMSEAHNSQPTPATGLLDRVSRNKTVKVKGMGSAALLAVSVISFAPQVSTAEDLFELRARKVR